MMAAWPSISWLTTFKNSPSKIEEKNIPAVFNRGFPIFHFFRRSTMAKFNTNGTWFSIKFGVEGPHYDPYSFEEIEIERLGHRYILHAGLAVWLQIDDLPTETLHGEDYDDGGSRRFEELTGARPDQWLRWYHKQLYRPKKGNCEVDGHDWLDQSSAGPDSGSIDLVCRRCGESVHTTLY
jgi:hypothetical protein